MTGSNLYTLMPAQAANHYAALCDADGYILFGKFDTASTPDTTANIFQKGCLMTKTDAANSVSAVYQNTGTLAAPGWTLLESGAGFVLPASVTDSATTTGVSLLLTEAALTTGTAEKIVASLLTTGIIFDAVAAAAVLTTGRYYSANDGATEVWGIGANGHIHSHVSAVPPSCAITAAHGITAATITAGSTDTCGVITTTGTQDNTTDSTLTITFGKTYTTAPKSITLTAANGAGAVGSSLPYIVSISATAVVIGVTKSAAAAATPSWYYQVIA